MSLRMLRREAEQGIEAVVLTPHYYASEHSPTRFVEKRDEAFQKLQAVWSPELPKLYLGAEVQYFSEICRREDLELLKIRGTNLLLIEMPFSAWTDRVVEDVLELNSRPYTQVVLAHIERYLQWQRKDVLPELLEEGVLIQSNASFFAEWKSRHKAVNMMKHRQIHLLGSDCHNMSSRQPNWDQIPEKIFEETDKRSRLITDAFF